MISIVERRIKQGHCQLCSRHINLSFHHLIPRKLHKRRRFSKTYTREELNQGIMICHRCHRGLHRLYSEMELGSRLNTLDALKANEAITKHVAWVSRQQN